MPEVVAGTVTTAGPMDSRSRAAASERVAWTGVALAAGVTASIGLAGALFPRAWLGLFTADPEVIAVGSLYLRTVGPAYGFFGLGLALYFASQGAGRLGWPLTAGFARLLIAAVGGWIATRWLGTGLGGLFTALAFALVVFGSLVAIAVKLGAWRRGRSSR